VSKPKSTTPTPPDFSRAIVLTFTPVDGQADRATVELDGRRWYCLEATTFESLEKEVETLSRVVDAVQWDVDSGLDAAEVARCTLDFSSEEFVQVSAPGKPGTTAAPSSRVNGTRSSKKAQKPTKGSCMKTL